MAYIEATDYSAYAGSNTMSANDFKMLSERASDIIDIITNQLIQSTGFGELTDAVQASVKKAVCAQLETLVAQGGISALTGNAENGTKAMSLGKFSVTKESKLPTINGIPVSPLVRGYLSGTGLLYRGAYP